MARIKYDPAVSPLTKKHYGYTFLNSSIGKSMAPGQRNARTRYPNQSLRQQNLQKCIRQWRNMDPATVANWNAFAAAYQQPTKRNPAIFLSGYQLFLKRNSYCFLNHGIDSDFMETPAMEELAAPVPTFELKSGSNVVDITELYIHNFGILPTAGQWLLFWAVPYSDTSGQFFAPINSVLECEEVFIDGLFLNLIIPDGNQNITYSVYLSKPVHAGSSYGGTKIRYMGCFTTKSFLGLSDTPGSYAGQAGKVPTVNVAEDALEFAAGGGGGLTCADLAACPKIISMDTQIISIAEIVSVQFNTSIPPLKNGLLYNFFCYTDPRGIFNSGFSLVTRAEWIALATYLGGSAVAGGYCKEAGLVYWNTPNTGADNSAQLNFRGSGYRNQVGNFMDLKNRLPLVTSTAYPFAPYDATYRVDSTYNSALLGVGSIVHKFIVGSPWRLCRPAVGAPDYQKGFYIGNNGRIYRTTVLNSLEFLADNFAETLFNNGDEIPWHGAIPANYFTAAEWVALTSAGICAYNNTWADV